MMLKILSLFLALLVLPLGNSTHSEPDTAYDLDL